MQAAVGIYDIASREIAQRIPAIADARFEAAVLHEIVRSGVAHTVGNTERRKAQCHCNRLKGFLICGGQSYIALTCYVKMPLIRASCFRTRSATREELSQNRFSCTNKNPAQQKSGDRPRFAAHRVFEEQARCAIIHCTSRPSKFRAS